MNKNLKFLWAADTISLFGTSIYSFLLVVLALDSSNSVFEAGLTLFVITIPYLFLGILGGSVADKYDKKIIMITCDLLRAIIVFLIPLSYYLFGEVDTIIVMAIGFLITSLRAFFYPAYQSSAPILIDQSGDLQKVNSLLNTTGGLSVVLGPAIGSIAYIFTENTYLLLLITSITFLLSALFISQIKFPDLKDAHVKSKKKLLNDAMIGIKYVFYENKLVMFMLVVFTVQLLIGDGIMSLALPNAIQDLGFDKGKFLGYCTSLISIGSILMSFIMSKIKIENRQKWIFAGYYSRGIIYALFSLSYVMGISVIFINCFLLGISYAISGPTLTTLLQKSTPEYHHGKVMALRSTIGNVTDSFSYIFIGFLITLSGVYLSFTIAAGIILIFTVALNGLMRKRLNSMLNYEEKEAVSK